jgi:hypothetical protein
MYEARRSRIAWALLTYLRKFPASQDTIDGITEWWLADQGIQTRPKILKGVLSELAAKGLILQHKGKDSQIHYRLNRRKSR